MTTQVLIAPTGQRLKCDSSQFASLDDLKAWVSQNSSIPAQHVVALTPQGRSVKASTLHGEPKIFIYDMRIAQPSSSSDATSIISRISEPRALSIPAAPNKIQDVKAISSWQSLYKERRSWALQLAEECSRITQEVNERYDEIDVMIKCLDAAMSNMEFSVKQIEPKHAELRKWVAPALEEHDDLAAKWQEHLDLARRTRVSPKIVSFMTKRDVQKTDPTLEDLVEPETVKKAGKLAPTAKRRFSDKAATLENANQKMHQTLQSLIADFDRLMAKSFLGCSEEASQLQESIEATVRQVDNDYRAALSFGGSQRDVAQASKTASHHTEVLAPRLNTQAKELDGVLRYATSARNAVAAESADFMRSITDITALHGEVKNHITILNQSEDDMTTFDYLRLIHQLPYMYASFMVEAIRRKEWMDKVKADSSTLANEMALFQDEESKRRKKWQRMVGSTYGPSLDTNVVGLEVNLLGEDTPWPSVVREELDDFVYILQNNAVDEAILNDVTALVADLQTPTKQQTKRLKAFKNGSVHEAALGRSGLLVRGDEDLLRSLQDDKGKLEMQLRTSESRVRRLEDLLHRQQAASRPSNLFQPPSAAVQQRNRSSSMTSNPSVRVDERRASSDQTESMQRRIVQLEQEVKDEKIRLEQLQKEHIAQREQFEGLRSEADEATSMKKDLMENMEALKREFDLERKSLEDEVRTLKTRLEDTEDEIDHFGASRENEKATYDERVHQLEAEIQQLTKNRDGERLKAQGQVDFLRNEARIQRERLEGLERDAQLGQREKQELSKDLETVQALVGVGSEAMKNLFAVFGQSSSPPDEISELAEALQTLATDSLHKTQNALKDLSLLRSELEQLKGTEKALLTEARSAGDNLAQKEEEIVHLQEARSEEKAKVIALEHEIEEIRGQMHSLRSRLADGETGSEELEKRLEDSETKRTELTEKLAAKQSQVGSLEEELHLIKEKTEMTEKKLADTVERHEDRDTRTNELTQLIYSQNDRLCRLLERIGYAVSLDNGEMTITKVPRAERTSQQNANDSSDPSMSLRRSTTANGRTMHDSTDLDLLYWMKTDEPSVEAEKYNAFMQTLGQFNVDLFSDTVYHRLKDTEHKARKWQRDLRAYRDRAHAMQKDAQDKIAFRHFKEGDLALFLPTRNQQAGAWAAFNVGFPHYFLREQDSHRLNHREWLVARITRIQERVVDLSKSLHPGHEADSTSMENENPFQLSDGLRWYLIDAHEDKPGAPSTPGMGKSTVASNTVEATASINARPVNSKGKARDSATSIEGINKTLSKSLDSRRSSTGSRKALPFAGQGGAALLKGTAITSETNSLRAAAPETPLATSPGQGGMLGPSRGEHLKADETSIAQPSTAEPEESEPVESARLQREESTESASKRSVIWETLWNDEYIYRSPNRK